MHSSRASGNNKIWTPEETLRRLVGSCRCRRLAVGRFSGAHSEIRVNNGTTKVRAATGWCVGAITFQAYDRGRNCGQWAKRLKTRSCSCMQKRGGACESAAAERGQNKSDAASRHADAVVERSHAAAQSVGHVSKCPNHHDRQASDGRRLRMVASGITCEAKSAEQTECRRGAAELRAAWSVSKRDE